jgi:ketosteroid isomerase-like protein
MTDVAYAQRAVEWLSAWARYDYETFRALTHDDIRFRVFGPAAKITGFNEIRGGARLADTFTGEAMVNSEQFPFTSMSWTIEHAVSERESVFIDASLDAGRKSGGRYVNRYWFLLKFKDDQVIEAIEVPTDALAQLEAIGVDVTVKTAPA